MSWLDAARHRLRTLFDRGGLEREMRDEIRFHLEQHARHERLGDSDASRRRFGNVGMITEDRRRASGLSGIDRILQDARYAGRQLLRSPGFTVAVVLTLALGIGANATMFAIVDRIMLRAPEGITDADRVLLMRSWTEARDGSRDSSSYFSYPSFMDFRGMGDVFEHVALVRGPMDVPVDRGPGATNARGALVAGDYFATVGVRPFMGRFFAPDETGERNAEAVVVLSHRYWRRHFAADPAVVGQMLAVGGTRFTVIGVAPRGFAGHTLSATDFWIPMMPGSRLVLGMTGFESQRGTRFFAILTRFKPGVTPAQASARVSTGWRGWDVYEGRRASLTPRAYFVSLVPGQNTSLPEHRVARLLTGVSLLLLLITCANVANLLLARALARRRETAIRLALGVRRSRLAMLFVFDALLLAVLGGAAALLVATLGIPLVRSILFAGTQTTDWGIDLRLVAVTMAIALVAGALAGIVPAIQACRPSVIGALKQGARDGTVHRSRTRVLLLVAQGALSVALLAGTGLFVRSLQRIGDERLGLDIRKVIVADFQVRRSGFDSVQARTVVEDMKQRALSIPGVESAALTVGVPFEGQYALSLAIPGHDSIPGMSRGRAPFLYAVTPDYFRTLGVRLQAGRLFNEGDVRGPAVAVINDRMAQLIWPDISPLGQCFKVTMRYETPDCIQVIGVVEDVRREALLETEPSPQYYVPIGQQPRSLSELTLLVRAADPARVLAPLGRSLQSVRADMPFVNVRTLEDAVAPELRPWRLGAAVFALFGVLALVVAAVGTYSVMQFSVSQRRHELGVRIALGARRGHVLRLVAGESIRIGAIAASAGLLVVLATGGMIDDFLFRTSPRDPLVLVSVVCLLMVCGVMATLLPAWRATKVDPVSTLKSE